MAAACALSRGLTSLSQLLLLLLLCTLVLQPSEGNSLQRQQRQRQQLPLSLSLKAVRLTEKSLRNQTFVELEEALDHLLLAESALFIC